MKKVVLTFCLFTFINLLSAQTKDLSSQIETSLEFEKDTFFVNEPFYFFYVLKNNSEDTIIVSTKGFYNNIRESKYKIRFVKTNENVFSTKKNDGINFRSGRSPNKTLHPNEEIKIRLFLSVKNNMNQVGKYNISVIPFFRNYYSSEEKINTSNPFNVDSLIADKEITIIKNSKKKLNSYINKLAILAKENIEQIIYAENRSACINLRAPKEYWVNKIEELNALKKKCSQSKELEDQLPRNKSLFLLCNIPSKQIIPYLEDLLSENRPIQNDLIIRTLNRFKLNKRTENLILKYNTPYH